MTSPTTELKTLVDRISVLKKKRNGLNHFWNVGIHQRNADNTGQQIRFLTGTNEDLKPVICVWPDALPLPQTNEDRDACAEQILDQLEAETGDFIAELPEVEVAE